MTTIQQLASDHRPPSPSPSQLPPVPSSPTYSYASTTANRPPQRPGLAHTASSVTTTTTTSTSTSTTANMAHSNMSAYSLPLPPPPPPTVPHAVLTKNDLAASQQSYAALLATAKAYRLALASLSTAASAFGSALEDCARLKEARADSLLTAAALLGPATTTTTNVTTSSGCTADALLAAAGVHHLVANHQQILSETVYRSFEVPLLHELDQWRRDVDDEEARYLAAVKRQSQDIRRLEKEGLRLHRQRGPRDVAKFRGHLVELTTKLDGLTGLHGEHARTLLGASQDTSVKIVEASCSLVRAEVDIFESLARKGWSGGGLDDILERGQDLFAPSDEDDLNATGGMVGAFATAGLVGEDAKLFSILPPGKSILADTTTTTSAATATAGDFHAMEQQQHGNFPRTTLYPGGGGGHQRADSLGVSSEPYQSLTGAVTASNNNNHNNHNDTDAASIFSADFTSSSGRPRMTRPFSPQPIRVRPEDVFSDDSDEVTHLDEEEDEEDDGDGDNSRASSPETIREEDTFLGSSGSRRLPRKFSLGGRGGEEDEDEEDEENGNGVWGHGKRMSSAASDPEERERRWNSAGSDEE